ncbi:hypothetical protein GCM10017673_06310 [Streptosporangium violaceochromogenes]|nr:hypothetical protein GCM10017673_06310 [Streptosporangium violaceochromogenes]
MSDLNRPHLKALAAVLLAMGIVTTVPGTADAAPVSIGTAAPFGVLGGTSVSNTNSTTVTGDLGVSPGSTVTGFPPGTVTGTVHANDATATQAKSDLTSAYNDVSGRTPDATLATQLGGTTRNPGVYNSTTGPFTMTGTLTLDAQGDPDAVFVFQATSLTTSNVANVALLRGAQADNVFWQVSGTATLGTSSTFRGNVLAQGAVTVSTGAAVFGRVFSLGSSVTTQGTASLPFTRVTVPNDPPTTTTLASSSNPSWKGAPVTFTATVAANSGSVVPAGEVVFKDGSTALGSDFLDPSGEATLTISSLSRGQHPITAVYLGGDTFNGEQLIHFAPSTSSVLNQNVSDSLWSATDTPDTASHNDGDAVTLGVKFRSSTAGTVTGIRFYKGSGNTGTHIGALWNNLGQSLGTVTFTGETSSGWQQATFATPIPITANTTYTASYFAPSGNYSITRPYFTSARTNGPLTALADGTDGGNGVYTYGASNTLPTSTYQASNYWVDVVFAPSDSLWDRAATPDVAANGDTDAITLGVKFRSSTAGTVTGIRFYKGSGNTGTHIGALWNNLGQSLGTVTFTGETSSGWQQADFATPIPITANTTYTASYFAPAGRYSLTRPYFTSAYTNGPLTALADGAGGGNGVYTYGASSTFPTSNFQASNYWVDVVFYD